MADYKIAFQLHQDSNGSENALARFSFNGAVIADNVEITSNDHTTPHLFVYDVTSGVTPAADAWHTIKVELLNDNYVDADDDRNLCLHRIGYLYKNPSSNTFISAAYNTPIPEGSTDGPNLTPAGTITDFTDITNFNTVFNFKYTSTAENETNGNDVGVTIEGGVVSQQITCSFAEYEIAFTEAEKFRSHVPNEQISYSTFGDNP